MASSFDITDEDVAALAHRHLQSQDSSLRVGKLLVGLAHLLISKGVITEAEWEKSIAVINAPLEQMLEQRAREQAREYLEEHPGEALLLKLFRPKD